MEKPQCEKCPSNELLGRNCAALICQGFCEIYETATDALEKTSTPVTRYATFTAGLGKIVTVEPNPEFL